MLATILWVVINVSYHSVGVNKLLINEKEGCKKVVNRPTRWSLLFIFGFLYWSSSWRWQPHIGVCRLLWPLLRAGMAVLTQFFCKMYFLYVSWSRRKNLGNFFLVLPRNSSFFGAGPDFRGDGSDFQRGGSTIFSNAPLYGMFRDQ